MLFVRAAAARQQQATPQITAAVCYNWLRISGAGVSGTEKRVGN